MTMTKEKKTKLKKILFTVSTLVISFVFGWVVHGVQSLYTSNYYIVMTNKSTGEQYAVPVYGSGWSKEP